MNKADLIQGLIDQLNNLEYKDENVLDAFQKRSQMNDAGRWPSDLAKELNACGYKVDANKLFQTTISMNLLNIFLKSE